MSRSSISQIAAELLMVSSQEAIERILRRHFFPAIQNSNALDMIRRKVERRFNLPAGAILSRTRTRNFAEGRHVAMWLARQLTTLTIVELGAAFGGMDHGSIAHAVKKVDGLRSVDAKFAGICQELLDELREDW